MHFREWVRSSKNKQANQVAKEGCMVPFSYQGKGKNARHSGAIPNCSVEVEACGVDLAKLGNSFSGRKKARLVQYLPLKCEKLTSDP